MRILRVFLVIARKGGFAAAQPELNISPSTISNHIKALEERLGVALCVRGRRGFALTSEGERVFEAATRMFEAIGAFETDAGGLKGSLRGRLLIGVNDGTQQAAHTALSSALRSIAERHRGVEVHIRQSGLMELQRPLVDGRLDAALLSFPQDLPLLPLRGLDFEPLYEETLVLCCGPGHSLAQQSDRALTLAELRRHRMVARENWPEPMLRRYQGDRAMGCAETADGVLALLLSDAYVGFLPRGFAQTWIDAGALCRLAVDEDDRRLGVTLAMRSTGTRGELVREFCRTMQRLSQTVPGRARQVVSNSATTVRKSVR